jgi:hypothetical protein
MCPDCYDYTAAVMLNAYAADLWRRFVTYLPRHLARRLGITQKLLRSMVRLRFVKVAEYQARGVVHFHAVIRLDAPDEDYQPPPPGITADILGEAIGQAAAAAVRLPVTAPGGTPVTLTFGAPQGTDVRPIRRDAITGTGQPLNYQAVANYIAKYTTKTLSVPGLPSQRLRRETDLERLRCPAHYRRMITTAWQLGTRYRAWAHMLGYGGHFLTKSRRYSVTFGQLRAARTNHRRANRPQDADRDAWGRPLDETIVLVLPTIWTYGGKISIRPRPSLNWPQPQPPAPASITTQPPPQAVRRQSLLDSKPANRRRSDASVKLPIECLWTVEETAQFLRVPKAILYQWRYLGIGPKAGRVGRHLRYDPADVIAWFRQQQEAE